ncbi:Polyketide cyclase / dehydrase and lipid transport [Klebsiella pneumoniae]|uniref:MxaD family protein n=2 Tax=Klebsiella pneumoniae TaxID=573 RepID=A0A422ZQZ2_KLEPN|nr:SRPBCC family protein [Klebsiella pneumoniae]HBW8923984.1 SRPBCC family protein [Klebsiella pneumoniae subsp. pneumoniae 1158]EIY1907749.1 SRPBCC family protein [Klebsiella pneumoniae]EIY1911635.1 SRPBCC family protein [Klebsiella pneumoniae]EJR0153700.1 SRPBCC family protein [Klebsiella pneumoniae]EJR0154494.1 SRPBCC family protein [Klebsiella pneumoniae]
MATTTISIEISASVDQVWQLMGGFDSLPDWLPFIPKSMVSEGGRVRTLTTSDGGTVIERLEAFDNRQRSYSYSIIQAPFPVVDYLSTIAVVATADSNITRVEWSGSFTPVNVSDADAEALFSGIYRDGLQALKNNFSA